MPIRITTCIQNHTSTNEVASSGCVYKGGGKSGGTWNTLPQSCQLLIVQFLATIVDLPVFVSSHRCAAILLANAAASQNLSASVKICQSKQAAVLKPSFGCTDCAWDLFRSRCLSIHELSHHVTVDGKSFIPLTTVVDGMAFLPLFFDGCDFLLSFLKTAAAVEPWSPNRGTVKPWGGSRAGHARRLPPYSGPFNFATAISCHRFQAAR